MQRELASSGEKYRPNFTATVVNTALDHLKVTSVTCSDARANAALKTIGANNEFELESKDVHRATAVFGQTYLLVWLDDDERAEFFQNSAEQMRLFYDPENRYVLRHQVRSREGRPQPASLNRALHAMVPMRCSNSLASTPPPRTTEEAR